MTRKMLDADEVKAAIFPVVEKTMFVGTETEVAFDRRDLYAELCAAIDSLAAAEAGEGERAKEEWRPALRNCPFCGGPVEMEDDPDAWKRGCGYSIDCTKCYASMNSFKVGESQCERPEELAARWNGRADVAASGRWDVEPASDGE